MFAPAELDYLAEQIAALVCDRLAARAPATGLVSVATLAAALGVSEKFVRANALKRCPSLARVANKSLAANIPAPPLRQERVAKCGSIPVPSPARLYDQARRCLALSALGSGIASG